MDAHRDPRDRPARNGDPEWSSNLLPGKVFDADGNSVGARLLIWGPEEVGGEACFLARPVDFDAGACAPDPRHDMETTPLIAADDLQLAIPLRIVRDRDEWVDIAGLTKDEAERIMLLAKAERFPVDGEFLFNFRVAVVTTSPPVEGRDEVEVAEQFLRRLLPVRELAERGGWRTIVTDIEAMRVVEPGAVPPSLDTDALCREAIAAIAAGKVGGGALVAVLEAAGVDPPEVR